MYKAYTQMIFGEIVLCRFNVARRKFAASILHVSFICLICLMREAHAG